jgi:hypothetical protein
MCPSPFSGAFIAIQVPKPRSFKSTIGVHCLESMRPLVPADARSRSGIATSGSNVMRPFEDFEAIAVQVEETHIFLRRFGSGPAVLLLHGFPQTHLMWRSVAPAGDCFPRKFRNEPRKNWVVSSPRRVEERAMELILGQPEAPMRVASTKRSVESSMLRPVRPRGA